MHDETDKDFIDAQFAETPQGEDNYPKFQWSKFGGKDEQFVVRANNQEEFDKNVAYIKTKYASSFLVGIETPTVKQPFAKPSGSPMGDQASGQNMCPIHQVEFIWSKYPSKFTGQKYLYHSYKDASGQNVQYCYEDKVRKQLNG